MDSPRSKKKPKKKLAVLDFETDPFKFGRIPKPFACDLYDGETHNMFWGKNCVEALALFLENSDTEYLIYAHNGGKFDFFFLLIEGYIENPVRIINGRLVKAAMGKHELRDSYAIIPVPLKSYQKDEIDYEWFEEKERQKHKKIINEYLQSDCVYLYELVSAFVDRFGLKLTIGSTAMQKLNELHPFAKTNESHDEKFRPFYFGGRVECFKTGIHNGEYEVDDVNSMYPYVMKEYDHPTGNGYLITDNTKWINLKTGELNGIFKNKPYFIHFTGKNRGALPTRTKTGLDFNIPEGEFFACGHEIKVALKYNLIDINEVHSLYIPNNTIKFGNYVDTYVEEKIKCQKDNDKVGTIFAKLLLNSAYGKFGQNPNNYMDYAIRMAGQPIPSYNDGWQLFADYKSFEIWEKPSESKTYFDVAVAASITSAARSVLLEAMQKTKGLLYCDTDSLICESFEGERDNHKLGAWKKEATGNSIAIAGKKLYALFDNEECVKLATKGVRLEPNDIVRVAKGEVVLWENAAPSFSLMGEATFIKREVRKTT